MPNLPPLKHLDVLQWPVIVYVGPTRVTDEEMAAVMDESHAILLSSQLHALCLDVSQTESLTATQRKMITDSMSRNEEMNKRYCAGVALVFENKILAGILTAIFWVKAPVVPTRVFSSRASAIAWLQQQIAARPSSASPSAV